VKNGVPYHLAMDEMTDAEVMAASVAFSELEGAKFDWDTMQFEKRANA